MKEEKKWKCPRCNGNNVTVYNNGIIRCDDCKDYIDISENAPEEARK